MSPNPYANCHYDIPREDCTLATCCIAQSNFDYLPSLGGNLFYAILFTVALLFQLGIGIPYKTWGYMTAMVMGLILEVLGYAARVWMHYAPFAQNPFLMYVTRVIILRHLYTSSADCMAHRYLICATIGPVFFSAAIYLCLARVMVLYGVSYRLQPRTVAVGFMVSDLSSLTLQAVGGALTDVANTTRAAQSGIDIAIAGLILQVISLAIFLLIMADFAWTCRKGVPRALGGVEQKTRERPLFKTFLAGLLLATILILIRCIYRVAELWGGLSGRLFRVEQVTFMVLEGAMVSLAVILLTTLHPGFAFADAWSAANWPLRKNKESPREMSQIREE